MKKFICGLLIGILLMLSIPAFGAVGQQINVAINSIRVLIDGQELTADNFVYKDRTYVQLKAITEAMDGTLYWDKETNTAVMKTKPVEVTEVTEVNPLPLKDIEDAEPINTPEQTTQPRGTTGETTPTPMATPEATPTPEPTVTPEATPTPEATLEPTPTPELTRTVTLVYDGSLCGCGATGYNGNMRTVYEGGQEYCIVDCTCPNPKCRFRGTVIGNVKWLIEYK